MTDRFIDVDGDKIQLVEVAEKEGKKLYRFDSDWRVVGAEWEEVEKKFPEYQPEPLEVLTHDYLIEEDGKIQFYYPDGSPIPGDEI